MAISLGAAQAQRVRGLWEPLTSRRATARYVAVAAATTAAYLALFALLRTGLAAGVANVIALLATTVANTAAHRRFTFGIRGGGRRLRAHAGGLAAMGLTLALTTAALTVLTDLDPGPSTLLAGMFILVATAVGSWLRFGPLRRWIGAAAMGPPEETVSARRSPAARP